MSTIHQIRGDAFQYFTECGIVEDQVADLLIAVGEIATDAVEHGHDTVLTVTATYCSGRLEICFCSESLSVNRGLISDRIASIEAGETICFVETGRGLGMRWFCALAQSVEITDDGKLRASFDTSNWLPEARRCLCMVA